MGTRGTLRVYVNDEIKIRQYNQWDSYPTGQFQEICEFMENNKYVRLLTEKLLNVSFAPAKTINRIISGKSPKDTGEAWLRVFIDRDIGARILLLIIGSPYNANLLPDWLEVHRDGFCTGVDKTTEELPDEEGNYEIHIMCEVEELSAWRKALKPDSKVTFRLSGDWHGCKREFDWNHIPTKDEIEEWEQEPDKE